MPTQMSRLFAQGFVGFFSFILPLSNGKAPEVERKIGVRTLMTMIPRTCRRVAGPTQRTWVQHHFGTNPS